MRTIHKYPLQVGSQRVAITAGARALSMQCQRGQLALWALVDPEAPPREVAVHVVGTGFTLPRAFDAMHYLGTAQMSEYLVWHAFAETKL